MPGAAAAVRANCITASSSARAAARSLRAVSSSASAARLAERSGATSASAAWPAARRSLTSPSCATRRRSHWSRRARNCSSSRSGDSRSRSVERRQLRLEFDGPCPSDLCPPDRRSPPADGSSASASVASLSPSGSSPPPRRRSSSRPRRAASAAPAPSSRTRSSRISTRSAEVVAANSRADSASRARPCSAMARSAASRFDCTASRRPSASPRSERAAAASDSASARRSPAAFALSRASSSLASSDCRSSRSCSSAASAWRFSGRRWDRASRSTSRARDRLSSVRASLSSARRRRLRCLPSPAASSIRSRRSRALEWITLSTRPCETTECISLPRPVSESASSTSTRRQRAPFRRYSPSPERSSRRVIDSSENSVRSSRSESSITTSTSAAVREGKPTPPEKITSCMVWPRTASGLCSPSAHSTASVTLDFPEPFGPTMTETPSANSSRVRSGKDLKPFMVIERRCISRPPGSHRNRRMEVHPDRNRFSASDAASCSALFFVLPSPLPISCPATSATARNERSCGGPCSEAMR